MSISNNIKSFDSNDQYSINYNCEIEMAEIQSDENDSNENIIFQRDTPSVDNVQLLNNRAYCGIIGNSEFSCILNVVVSSIGGGCFGFPYIVYEGGIIIFLILFVFVSICVYYSLDLLRSFVVDTKYFSFASMTEAILGVKWLRTYAICSFTIYTSMVVSYLSTIFIYLKGMHNLENVISIILYFLISMIIEIIICLYVTKIANMYLLSMISIICFIVVLFSLIVVSIVANCTGEVSNKFVSHNLFFPDLYPDNFLNKLFKMSCYIMIYVYGYSYHSTFPTLIGSLKNVNNSNTKKVHIISFGIISIAYFLFSIFGFLLSNIVPNEIFQENDDLFKGGWATLRKPFKYILIIFLLLLIPIRFIVLRDNYITLIGKKKLTVSKELGIVTLFIIICNFLVFCVAEFDKYFSNLQFKTLVQTFGGMFGVIISFCLPVVNYVSVNGKRKIKSIIGYIILSIFVLIGIFSTGHTFYHIFVGSNKKKNE